MHLLGEVLRFPLELTVVNCTAAIAA